MNEKQTILKHIDSLSRRHGKEKVFRDWTHCIAIAMQNACSLQDDAWKAREAEYLSTMKQYTKDEQDEFVTMYGKLTDWFERRPFGDHLGELYMEGIGGNSATGQCFTPYSMCQACAGTTLDTLPDHRPITISDPACGGGALLIAACEKLYLSNVNYQTDVVFDAGDIDSVCVDMTYIQLSLLGCRAIVHHRNAISLETLSPDRHTLMYWLRYGLSEPHWLGKGHDVELETQNCSEFPNTSEIPQERSASQPEKSPSSPDIANPDGKPSKPVQRSLFSKPVQRSLF